MRRESRRSFFNAAIAGRLVFLPIVVLCLLSGICGGLLRAGVAIPQAVSGAWLGHAVQSHAFLMVCAVMGTVIGLERAVAVRKPVALLAPLAADEQATLRSLLRRVAARTNDAALPSPAVGPPAAPVETPPLRGRSAPWRYLNRAKCDHRGR